MRASFWFRTPQALVPPVYFLAYAKWDGRQAKRMGDITVDRTGRCSQRPCSTDVGARRLGLCDSLGCPALMPDPRCGGGRDITGGRNSGTGGGMKFKVGSHGGGAPVNNHVVPKPNKVIAAAPVHAPRHSPSA